MNSTPEGRGRRRAGGASCERGCYSDPGAGRARAGEAGRGCDMKESGGLAGSYPTSSMTSSLSHYTRPPPRAGCTSSWICLNPGHERFKGVLINKNLPLFLCLLIRN
jgi:hypothetical protein